MFNYHLYSAVALAIACTLQGCSLNEQEAVPQYGNVNVSFINDSFECLTKAETDAEGAGVRFVSLAAVSGTDGSIAFSGTQKTGDDGFGSIGMTLPIGKYTIVAEGNAGTDSYGNATIATGNRIDLPSGGVRETFCATQSVTVNADDTLNVAMTLSRITAKLKIVSTVSQPSGVKQVLVCVGDTSETLYTAYYFNPADGLMSGFGTDGYMLYNKSVGSFSGQMTSFSFDLLLGESEQNLPVIIKATDGFDNVLYTHSLPSVSFAQNCTTIIEGPVFAVPSSATLKFETTWGTDIDAGW